MARSHIQSFENTTIGKCVLPKPAVTPSLPVKTPPAQMKIKQQEPKIVQPSKRLRAPENDPISSSKKPKMMTPSIPSTFENLIKVFSGEKYGKQGYCVRFNDGDYVRDDYDNIIYFPSQAEAKQAAYAVFTL